MLAEQGGNTLELCTSSRAYESLHVSPRVRLSLLFSPMKQEVKRLLPPTRKPRVRLLLRFSFMCVYISPRLGGEESEFDSR